MDDGNNSARRPRDGAPSATACDTGPAARMSGRPVAFHGHQNRAHLLAAMIGGSNKDPRNFVTMHHYANTPVMRTVEMQVRDAVRDGEFIQCSVTPICADDNARIRIPLGVTIEAHGDRRFQMRPRGSDSATDSFTLWNRAR